MKILADATLPGLMEAFPSPFQLSLYHNQEELKQKLSKQDILLCRANLKVNQALLAGTKLSYIATASSGSDNLDKIYLKNQGIHCLDAKGCNAHSVADYVLSCLAFLDKQALIKGKKLGIIGLGHVGSTLFQRLQATDFDLVCYDPLKAASESHFTSCELTQLYHCDILCIHAELHDSPQHPSKNLISQDFLQKLQPKCVIINASRGGIVNEEALLSSTRTYCTDVYSDEPRINPHLVKRALLCTPHIAGHSLEAKYAALRIISQKIHSLLSLPLPYYLYPCKPEAQDASQLSWQELALLLYNPLEETQVLKQADNLEQSFLDLRQAHKNRHDFQTYFTEELSPQLKTLFF